MNILDNFLLIFILKLEVIRNSENNIKIKICADLSVPCSDIL